MEKYAIAIQTLLTGIGAWVSAKMGILEPLLVILIIMMCIDYLTGMLASKQEALDNPNDSGYGWSSKKGAAGIIKKVGYLCVTATAMVVDYIIMYIAAEIGITVTAKAFFALLVTAWYILNELLSIIENTGRLGAPVPEWLKKYIVVLKETVDSKADSDKND